MVIKKTELYSSLWASCDELRADAYEYLMRHFATELGKSKCIPHGVIKTTK